MRMTLADLIQKSRKKKKKEYPNPLSPQYLEPYKNGSHPQINTLPNTRRSGMAEILRREQKKLEKASKRGMSM